MYSNPPLRYFSYSRTSLRRMWTTTFIVVCALAVTFIGIGVYSWFASPLIASFVLPLMIFLGIIMAVGMLVLQTREQPRLEAMRIGIGPGVLQRIFQTTTEEFVWNTFRRVRVVVDRDKRVHKIELYGAHNTAITIMDFDTMDELYENVRAYLPDDVHHEWVTRRVDITQPAVVVMIIVLAFSSSFAIQFLWGPLVRNGLVGVSQIIAAFMLWRYKPWTRRNPEYKWLERLNITLFLFMGFLLIQAYFR